MGWNQTGSNLRQHFSMQVKLRWMIKCWIKYVNKMFDKMLDRIEPETENTCFHLSAAHLTHTHTLLKGITRDKVIHTSASPPHPHRPPPAPPTSTFSPGFSSVIVMKGNGAEKGRKGDFSSYLMTPTVGGANSQKTHQHASPLWICWRTTAETTLV